MIRLVILCLLLLFCWPLGVLALVLYPIVWLVLLPFRLVGLVVRGAFELVLSIFLLPVRVLRAI